jgi:hypothetical protein
MSNRDILAKSRNDKFHAGSIAWNLKILHMLSGLVLAHYPRLDNTRDAIGELTRCILQYDAEQVDTG